MTWNPVFPYWKESRERARGLLRVVRGTHGRRLLPLLGVALVLLAWTLIYPYTRYLSSPQAIAQESVELLGERETYFNIGVSFRRLIFGLLLGYGGAVIVTLLMRAQKWWEWFFAPYVFISLTTPSLVAAFVTVIVFGFREIAVYFAIGWIIFPFVVVSIMEGLRNVDARHIEMARLYKFEKWQRYRHVVLPEMSPHMFAAFRNAHSYAWKLVVVVEIFSQTNGIGYQYKKAFDFFELDLLTSWVVFFLVVLFGVEYGILRPFEKRVYKWRSAESQSNKGGK